MSIAHSKSFPTNRLTILQALEAHRRLLDKHLEIWKKAEVAHAQDVQITSAAKSCQQRTEQMIQQCSSVSFLKPTNGVDVMPKKKHKRSEDSESQTTSKRVKLAIEAENNATAGSSTSTGPKRIPVTKDPSGLFQIDSNPDDVEALIKQAEKLQQAQKKQQAKQKRRHQPEAEEVDVSLEVEGSDRELSTSKRKKARHSETVQEPANYADDYDEEFERKVALRLKEKEEDRKKKANKKRKRESEASVEEPEAAAEGEVKQTRAKKGKDQTAAAPTKSPKGSKRKKGNSKDAEQKPKKKKRKRSK